MTTFRSPFIAVIAWLALLGTGGVSSLPAANPAADAAPNAEGLAFFEGKVRPLLAKRCYRCHSERAEELKGGLRLDLRPGWETGGHSGPALVPGDPDGSRLVQAIRYTDKDLQMPPDDKRLAPAEVAILEQWIRMGAPDPRDGAAVATDASGGAAKGTDHWSFKSPAAVTPPKVKHADWPRTEVDRFILAGLETRGLQPGPDADRRTLIRRATFDLTGLPPTPEEIDAFVSDPDPNDKAFDQVIDRLLNSRHYGERWGRHWMDLVRYADTAGDNSDFPIPQAWLFRNYLIDAFNADKPYDRFLREQIAGDLLPSNNEAQRREQLIATGYLASARRFGSLIEQYPEHLTIEDTIDNLGRTVLGLTVSCARCHDHKFDPITARDYYGLYGILASTRYPFPGIELFQSQRDLVPFDSKEKVEAALKSFTKETDPLNRKFDDLMESGRRLTLECAEAEAAAGRAAGPEKAELEKRHAKLKGELDGIDSQTRNAGKALSAQLKKLPVLPSAYAVQDGIPHDATIQVKGEPAHAGAMVPRKFPDILGGQILTAEEAKSSGRRQLADWLTDPKNPLTARVMVNRLWQKHFGRGLVETTSDFGTRGLAPSHPELLDWLAERFVAEKWSIKAMHRLMLQSRVYQLAATDDPALVAADPDNRLLGRFTRTRLDAETLRDTLLLLGGDLDLTPLEEPHPFPPMSKWEYTQHHPFKDVYESQRRSVYLMMKRLTALPYFQTFDGADPNASTPARDRSVTALQALYLLNDAGVHEQAEAFARRVMASHSDDKTRLEKAFVLTLARPPNDDERDLADTHLGAVRERSVASGCDDSVAGVAAWTSLAHTIFQLNEFLYVD